MINVATVEDLEVLSQRIEQIEANFEQLVSDVKSWLAEKGQVKEEAKEEQKPEEPKKKKGFLR